MTRSFSVPNEFAPLAHVVMGRAAGYHRDPARVEVVNGLQGETFATRGAPSEAQLAAEFDSFTATMQAAGVTVHIPDLADESVQDQTCPRDIGFVLGDTFVTAGMRNASRVQEVDAIARLLAGFDGPRISVPEGVALEGGDVIIDGDTLYVGCGQRSDPAGAEFLRQSFGTDFNIVPIPTQSDPNGEDILHLDCTFNPLGLGHALIYPGGIIEVPAQLHERHKLIEVTRAEARALATNVLSIAPDHLIARSHPDCTRVNGLLRAAGYTVSEINFDGVPGTGGSFRCATLPLHRRADRR